MTRHALLRTGLCFIFVLTPTPTTTQKCIGHLKFHFVFDASYYSDGDRDWIRWKLLYYSLRYLIGYFLLSIQATARKEFTSGCMDRGLQNMVLFISWF